MKLMMFDLFFLLGLTQTMAARDGDLPPPDFLAFSASSTPKTDRFQPKRYFTNMICYCGCQKYPFDLYFTEGRKIDTTIGSNLGVLKTEDSNSNSRTITSTRHLIGHSKALILIVVGEVHPEDTTEGNMEADLSQEEETEVIEATIITTTTTIHTGVIFIPRC